MNTMLQIEDVAERLSSLQHLCFTDMCLGLEELAHIAQLASLRSLCFEKCEGLSLLGLQALTSLPQLQARLTAGILASTCSVGLYT